MGSTKKHCILVAGIFIVAIAGIRTISAGGQSSFVITGANGGTGGSTGPTGAPGATGATGTFSAVSLSYAIAHTIGAGDCGNLVTMNGTTLSLTLANPTVSASCLFAVQNLNVSPLTIARNSLTINGGAANITLAQYQWTQIWSTPDAANYLANPPVSVAPPLVLTWASNGASVSCPTCGITSSGTLNNIPIVITGLTTTPWQVFTHLVTNQGITNSITLTPITGLTYNFLAATTYHLRCGLTTNTSLAGGLDVQVAYSGNTTTVAGFMIPYDTGPGSTINSNGIVSSRSNNSQISVSTPSQAGNGNLLISLDYDIVTSTSGTLTIQFSQFTGSGTTTIISGSWCEAWPAQ